MTAAPPGPAPDTARGAPARDAIEVCSLTHTYADGTLALRGVDLQLAPGEALAIVGANGAGKSTLLLHLNGLLLPGGGSVRVGDLLIEHRSQVGAGTLRELRRRVGFVFQDADDQLFMPTVQDDVAFGPLNLDLSDSEVVSQTRWPPWAPPPWPRAPRTVCRGARSAPWHWPACWR